MLELDRLNKLIQSKRIQKDTPFYQREGPDHDSLYTCDLRFNVTGNTDAIIVRGDPAASKRLAYANTVKKFFIDYDALSSSDGLDVDAHYDVEVIIDLDNSGDLLRLLEHQSININAFAAKQYSGPVPTYGTLTRAKSLVHDATDLLIAYRAMDIVARSKKKNVLLVSKDSAFDSLYREMADDFDSKNVYLVTSRMDLDGTLADLRSSGCLWFRERDS